MGIRYHCFFITHLPKSRFGHDAVSTYVDRFARRVYFVACTGKYAVIDAASNFMNNIVKQHGLRLALVSANDTNISSKLWVQHMEKCGIGLQ